MRHCKIYFCDTADARLCCADCTAAACDNRCKNSPDRCRCVEADRDKRVKVDKGEVIRLAKHGYTNREIAEQLGCSSSHVSYITTRAGLRRRRVVCKGGGGNGK